MKAYLVFSKITALVFFVIFILFIPHFKEKTINNNLEENVLKNQELEKYYNFKKNFGNDRVMIAAFSFKNKNAGILKILFEIENKLLETGSAERIFSPLTILKDVFCIKEKKDFLNWCSDPVRVNNYYALFDKFSTLQKSILSKDGLTAAMIIYLSDTIKDTDISNIDEIKKIVLQSKLENVKITGIPDIVKVIHEYTLFSQKYFTPITIALILGVLFLLYGSLKIILIALFSIIMPLVITMGLFNYLGNSTNFIISMIPPLILGVALTSCIHILTDYFIRSRQAGIFSADLLKETIKEQYIPILLCQLTTFCGFASLAANGLGAIKQYGIYSALSIIFIVVSILFVLPALIQICRLTNQRATVFQQADRFFEGLGNFIIRQKKKIVISALALVLFAGLGAAGINIETSLIKYLPASHPVIRDIHYIESVLSGIVPVQIGLHKIPGSDLTDPAVCLAISQLQKELENLENLDSAVSYVDLIMDYDKTFSGEKNNIPPSSQEVKEYLEFYQPPVEHEYVTEVMRNNEGITTEIRFVQLPLTPDQQDRGVAGFITPGYEQAQISLRIKDVSSAKLKALFDRITEKCSHYLKDKAGFYLTGRARLWAVTSEILVKNEILNFLLALFFIDIIMMIQFRSVKTGLIALLPNVLPIMVIFALMGLYDIALNTVTGIIACVAIGMSVDDTIHYIHSFVSFNKKGHTPEEALVKSLQFKGSSMIFTTIVIITGFAVLIVSDFVPTRQFGLFISGVFFMALVFDLVLTPALLIMFVKPSEGVKK